MTVSGIIPSATGARLGRTEVASKACAAESPSGSEAVTVMLVRPGAAGTTKSVLPDTRAIATSGSEDSAEKLSESPSGSVKWALSDSSRVSPSNTESAGIEVVTRGRRLGTATVKDWSAVRPSGSRAVTVTVAVPFATATTHAVSPATAARATRLSVDVAEKSRESPSGSAK